MATSQVNGSLVTSFPGGQVVKIFRWAAVAMASSAGALGCPAGAEAGSMFLLNGTDPIPLIPPPVWPQPWMATLFGGAYAEDLLVNVAYPASVWPLTFDRPTMGRSVRIGAQMTESLVRETTSGEITVIGMSQGALVVDQLAGALAADVASSGNRITFISVADPNRGTGLFTLLPAGTYISFLDLTTDPPPDSPYDTTVLVKQYDGVSNFPDRPWNFVADLNAAMGILYYHIIPLFIRDPIPTRGGTSVTNPLGGVTTTYFIPTPNLPLTQPLRNLGFPADFVNELDAVLRPIVDDGYSQLTPDAGPHISYGQLVYPAGSRPVAATAPAVRSAGTATTVTGRRLPSAAASRKSFHDKATERRP